MLGRQLTNDKSRFSSHLCPVDPVSLSDSKSGMDPDSRDGALYGLLPLKTCIRSSSSSDSDGARHRMVQDAAVEFDQTSGQGSNLEPLHIATIDMFIQHTMHMIVN